MRIASLGKHRQGSIVSPPLTLARLRIMFLSANKKYCPADNFLVNAQFLVPYNQKVVKIEELAAEGVSRAWI